MFFSAADDVKIIGLAEVVIQNPVIRCCEKSNLSFDFHKIPPFFDIFWCIAYCLHKLN